MKLCSTDVVDPAISQRSKNVICRKSETIWLPNIGLTQLSMLQGHLRRHANISLKIFKCVFTKYIYVLFIRYKKSKMRCCHWHHTSGPPKKAPSNPLISLVVNEIDTLFAAALLA
jgi:hypothetical protein